MNDDLQAPIPTDHNTRRTVWIEIALIYGVVIAGLLWNWLA